MSWLVDNAGPLYVLLGVIAAGFVIAWRFNQRVKYLGYAAGVLVLIAVVWLLTQYVPSDSKQLQDNVEAMASAVRDGRMDDVFKHISRDFRYKDMTRDALYEKARRGVEGNRVSDIKITAFNVDKLDRAKKLAKVSFRVTVWGAGGDQGFFFTRTEFVLEGEQWKLTRMQFFNPVVEQDQEINLPLP